MHTHKFNPRSSKPTPPVGWIKRRARKLMHFYGLLRVTAVTEALSDYQGLRGQQPHHFGTLS